MSKLRILSIDGGGMKGIISAMVLQRLEQLIQKYSNNSDARISEYFDLIGGTSTGAIMTALYLCPNQDGKAKFTAKEVVDLYASHGKEIFRKKKLYPINTLFGLLSPKYTNKALAELLTQYFNEMRLKDLMKPCLLASYNTVGCKAAFFTTVSSKSPYIDQYLVKDVVLASAAAPTYFPPIKINNKREKNCYIDGGVVANNPALCTLIEGIKLKECREKECKGLEDILLVSIGNVSKLDSYTYEEVDGWGMAGWAIPVLQIIMDSNEQTVDYTLNKLFQVLDISQNYYRINLNTKEKTPAMDDVSQESITKLIEYGEKLTKQSEYQLHQIAKRLVMNNLS